jgi:Holliday junction resolvasome RuvABC ATP-dependent DNA helicase subunit
MNAADLRFIPVFGRSPELTEEVQERFAVLSQILYTENYLALVIDRSAPTMTARIEQEFRHELPVRVLLRVCL